MTSPFVAGAGDDSIDQTSEDPHENSSMSVPGPVAVAPPPLSPKSYGRPRAPTTSTCEDGWAPPAGSRIPSTALSGVHPADSPIFDLIHPSKTVMHLPDPSQFPDPASFRPHHNMPALSSAGSSSTRSSAYTSSGSAIASGDYGHIHVASGEDDSAVGMGITSDTVVQLLAHDGNSSSSARPNQSRTPIDQSRWSESYPSLRSRSSSIVGNVSTNGTDNISPQLHQKTSYDTEWQAVEEREETGLSEDETDDEQLLGDPDPEEENEEERTSAAVIAEEGRGLIVHGGNVPIAHLQVQQGTTHLLIGSSSTPNAMPAFLTTTLPQICNTLLALDISANFLGALPPVLAVCENLEELNIAFNPLRVLPVFLADLTNLRVLIADSTGINTLPDPLMDLDKLHTISVRKNKLHALPSWLCLLPALQTLCVDGNPFQGPWKALVEPLLSRVPMSPMCTPLTPSFPPPSPAVRDPLASDIDTESTDADDLSDSGPPSARLDGQHPTLEDEDHTITPDRAPPILGRSVTSPLPLKPSTSAPPQPRGLTRTRTTPNRSHFDQSREPKATLPQEAPNQPEQLPRQHVNADQPMSRELRKMKSAGDLRRGKSATPASPESGMSPPRKPLARYPASASSSNLLNLGSEQPSAPGMSKRFATMGPSSSHPGANGMRTQLTQSLWDGSSETPDESVSPSPSRVVSLHQSSSPSKPSHPDPQDGKYPVRSHSTKDGKDRSGSRWGFLKKMSMGKMKLDSPPPPLPQSRSVPIKRSHTSGGPSSPPPPSPIPPNSSSDRIGKLPQIDVRFSTTGILESLNPSLSTPISPPRTDNEMSPDFSKLSPPSSNLLAPPSTLTRSAKRRSFLPVGAPGDLLLNILSESPSYTPSLNPVGDGDDLEVPTSTTPSPPIDAEKYIRREEERAREGYTRALRSVMAYLKDMNDLGLSQQPNPMSIYGAATDDVLTHRSRRPTMVDGQREASSVVGSPVLGETSGQLRSMESIAGLRSGGPAQTLSVATTDSNGSSDERKFKDDKGKRAMIVREIVATERTYVRGLQELVDIYIKPASIPVNILSGSSKETVVPASERKVVFGGVDALFSFHKDSFLPALEVAAAPIMKSSAELQEDDADGQLSLSVVKAVAGMFLKHAAFMKMYSTYINNFDNSVQRVKYWSSDRLPGSSSPAASAISPASSTAQLVGLGLSMSSVTTPGLLADSGTATGIPNLTTGQRKRIRTYLKRSRLNPRHSQLNLEGYLLLPVQRIPRYRLLLEELLRSTPPTYEYMEDPLDRALAEISSLANNMNEGKRESESRRKLVQWQSRIRGRFPSPLVQPHRRLIMDGPLLLTRVVRKAMVSFEAINPQGDASTVQVDCLAPELTPRTLVGILCNDLLVLCRDPSEGRDPNSSVDLWAVLRMQTLPQPASIVHGNVLRLVDNKAILYFDAPSPSDALNWYRAINLHIPASKT